MIHEIVTISAVEQDCIWVEATPKSACGACAARSGCGQRLLGKLMAKPNLVRVPLNASQSHQLSVGDEVQVGVPEDVLVSGSVMLYLIPVVALMLFAGFATVLAWSDGAVAASALLGLLLGALGVSRHAQRRTTEYSPILIEEKFIEDPN